MGMLSEKTFNPRSTMIGGYQICFRNINFVYLMYTVKSFSSTLIDARTLANRKLLFLGLFLWRTPFRVQMLHCGPIGPYGAARRCNSR